MNGEQRGPQGTIGEPATMKNGLAVGATLNTPEFYGADTAERSEDFIAEFSSMGPSKVIKHSSPAHEASEGLVEAFR